MLELLDVISRWAIPVLVTIIPVYGVIKGVRVYEAFIEGAKEGFWVAVKILPYMVSILVAMGIFRQSGAMEILVGILQPVLGPLGVPGDVLPLALVRPLSGGGALGILVEILHKWGPDSFLGRVASTMQGSTDTTIYILTLYFGSVGIKNSRHALAAGLLGDLAGFLASVLVVRAVFGP